MSDPPWKQLSLEFDGHTQTAAEHVLDLGVVGEFESGVEASPPENATCKDFRSYHAVPEVTTYPIKITSYAKRPLNLNLIVLGSRTSASFENDDSSQMLLPGHTATIELKFSRVGTKPQDLNRLLIVEDLKPITGLSLDYFLLPASQVVRHRSGGLPSGPRNDFSPWYLVETGAAPPKYAVGQACYWLTGDRACGNWSNCSWGTVDNTKVAFSFSLQGHEEDAVTSINLRTSEGWLLVRYDLTDAQPALKDAANHSSSLSLKK